VHLRLDREIPPPHRKDTLLLGGIGLTVLALARFFPWEALPSFCTFRNVTGHPCPGCGMTRAWVFLSHGEVAEAIRMNPFGSFLFVWTLLALGYLGLRTFAGIPALRLALSRPGQVVFWGLLGGALAANWAYTWITGVSL
jgi:hypothetical protein